MLKNYSLSERLSFRITIIEKAIASNFKYVLLPAFLVITL